ncbi:hypothetical protein JCM10908_006253 [Rhodotorula pacifica]|uniref:uncharacterized protein n=1 Tax=Rhodotorula pacifica TaxID=1495444 RepID=UPI00317DE1A5
MGTAFVPITSALAPYHPDRLGGGHRTDSISSSIRPFPLSPTRRTFSICDFEPKIKVAVQHNEQAQDAPQRGTQPSVPLISPPPPPPPPYPYWRDGVKPDKAARIELYKDNATFRPLPLKLRPERKRHSSRTVSSYLRARAAAANRTGFWRWRGLSLHDTFAPLELLFLGLVSLYAAATLVSFIETGLDNVLASGRKGLIVRRLEEISAQSFAIPIAITARDRYVSLIANCSTGVGALIALGGIHLSTRFFFLVVPYTFAIGCTFFGCPGFISGLYRLLTRSRRVLKPPTNRALRRNATLRRMVYLVDLTALVHLGLTVFKLPVTVSQPRAIVWALYALLPSFLLIILETISSFRRGRVEAAEAETIKYRLPEKGDDSAYCPSDTSQLQLVTVDGLETENSGAESGAMENRRWV